MTANPFASATRVAALIRRRRGGALEQLNATLQRVAALNPRINAVIALRVDAARKEARAIDRALARGEKQGPLAGVAMTVKESFNVAGLPTTWGLEEYKGRPVAEDALSVRRLKAAGAVIFGKTNVPVLLADWQTFNPVYGTTNNPYDVTRVPGGSSGGAAAALAAGITGLEMGSDIGASIRDPAHYCGVYGHKPTYGICSPQGHALPGSVAAQDISVIGPLARSADDLKLALGVIAGPDAIDARGWRLAFPKPRKTALKDYTCSVIGKDQSIVMGGDVFVMAKTTDAAQIKAQALLAKILLDKDTQLLFAQKKGSVPIRMDVDTSQLDGCAQKAMTLLADPAKQAPSNEMLTLFARRRSAWPFSVLFGIAFSMPSRRRSARAVMRLRSASSDACVMRRLSAAPTMPATFSVPARRWRSWPPPFCCARNGTPRRM